MAQWFILSYAHGVAVAITCKCNWEFGASLPIERGCDRPVYSWGTCHPWRWTNTRLAPTRSGSVNQAWRWHLSFKRQGLELRRSELLVNKVSPLRWGPTPVAHPNPQARGKSLWSRCESGNHNQVVLVITIPSIATTATRSRSHIKTVGKDLGWWFHLLGCRKQVKPHDTKQKAMVGASSQDSKRTSGLLWWWVACYQDNFLAACSWRPVENLHVVYLGFLVLQTNSGYWNEDYPGSSQGQTENIAIGAQGQLFAKDPRAYWIPRYCQIVHCACVEL